MLGGQAGGRPALDRPALSKGCEGHGQAERLLCVQVWHRTLSSCKPDGKEVAGWGRMSQYREGVWAGSLIFSQAYVSLKPQPRGMVLVCRCPGPPVPTPMPPGRWHPLEAPEPPQRALEACFAAMSCLRGVLVPMSCNCHPRIVTIPLAAPPRGVVAELNLRPRSSAPRPGFLW